MKRSWRSIWDKQIVVPLCGVLVMWGVFTGAAIAANVAKLLEETGLLEGLKTFGWIVVCIFTLWVAGWVVGTFFFGIIGIPMPRSGEDDTAE